MQIVVPMSGFGERFRRAGYQVPKPLIWVDEKTIIEHVIALFPGETDFTFICNQDHLDEPSYKMREILEKACPTGKITSVKPHKLGPVHAVQQILGDLDRSKPTLVNYCDFSQFWDWGKFKQFIVENDCDGCLPSYRGFHPHSLGSTFYAYLKLDEEGEKVVDIQEKQPWTDSPLNEYASSGSYYFKTTDMMAHYFERTRDENLMVSNEYYVSMAYRPMAYDGNNILPYNLEHFMQWGTPDDLQEYQVWDRLFRNYENGHPKPNRSNVKGSLVVPMAGLGSRFQKEGYKDPKPLIKVDDKIMVVRAVQDMPKAERSCIVTRQDLPQNELIIDRIKDELKEINFISMDKVSDGQAISCLEGLKNLTDEQMMEPLTIAACDNGVMFDADLLDKLTQDADCLVWGYSGHVAAKNNPLSYSWIKSDDNGDVSKIGVKETVGDTATTPIVIGAFTFASAKLFKDAVERMIDEDDRTNGEFYADGTVNHILAMGNTAKLFPVNHFVSFGTPNELKTYQYWQRCFSRWSHHPLTPFESTNG